MRIRVKSLQGEEYIVETSSDQTVSQLKSSISEMANGLATERIKLIYKGRTMKDTSPVGEYYLEEDCKVHLILQKDLTVAPSTNITKTPENPACPMNVSPSNAYSSRVPKSDIVNSEARLSSAFESILRDRLSKLFTTNQVNAIISNIHHEISDDINSSSLDDLERLAKQKLQISNE